MNCQCTDCKERAALQVGFQAWATGYTKASPPLRAWLTLAICERCAAALKVDDVISDDGWKATCAVARAVGGVPPDRASVELMFKPFHVEGPEDLKLPPWSPQAAH